MRHLAPALVATLLASGVSWADEPAHRPVEAVSSVDLERYLGTWFEIASTPMFFTRGCHASTATYSARDDGDIRVVNACRRGGLDGEPSQVEGKAWVPDASGPGELKVQFQWPFSDDYWIIELGGDYEYAVVGHPDRAYLWVLAREPWMEPALYDAILLRMAAVGYDPSQVVKTPQVVSGTRK